MDLEFLDPEPAVRSCIVLPSSPESPPGKQTSCMECGSLSQRIHTEALVQFVQDFCGNEINEQKLHKLKERIDNIIPFNPSTKHMSSRIFPQMKPSPSLERFQKKVA